MASGGLYEELTELVSCEICLEPLEGRNPRVLPCSHIFCEKCIQQLLNAAKATHAQSSSISCPMCRQKVQIPGGSTANLPLFYYLSKVENIRKDICDRYKICKMCKSAAHKAYVTSYCFVCGSGHCDNCRINHDEVFHNHAQISITQSTVNCIMCADHDAHFTHFCMTCSKALCNQCYAGKHRGHKVYDLAYDGKKVQENLKEILLSGMKSANDALANLVELESKLSRDIKTAMEEMKHHQDYLLKLVNDQYEALCLELNQREVEIKKDLRKSKQLVEDARLCIDRLLKETESWHEPVKGIPESRIKNTEKLVADVKQEMPSLDLDIKPQTVKFVQGDTNNTFGKIVQETFQSDVVAVWGSLKGQMAAAAQREDVSVNPTLLYEIKTEDNIQDIDYLDNGHLVVCMSKGICVYNGQSLVSNHYIAVNCRPSDNGELRSVCVCKKTAKVVVLEKNGLYRPGYLHVYRPEGDSWQYNRYEVCVSPECMSVTSCGEYIVYGPFVSGMARRASRHASRRASHGVFRDVFRDVFRGASCGMPGGLTVYSKLYKYNSVGEQMCSVDMSHDGVVCDVSVDDNDMILVCHKNTVVVYNKECQLMSTLSRTDRQLEPCGVCVNTNGEISVSDGRSRDVLLFNKKHCFVKSLIHLDFLPGKINVYKNIRLSVCAQFNNKVCVYKV